MSGSAPKTHTVEQGEYASGIASAYGLAGYKKIWSDPANAEVKKARENPNILAPGDKLLVPGREERVAEGPTEKRHRFKRITDKLVLRVVIRDESDRPVANADCRLQVERQNERLVTDGGGKVELRIPPGARTGRVVVDAPKVPLTLDAPIGIGELDPISMRTGQIGRLNNLGYRAGEVTDTATQETNAAFQSAVEEFQADHGLKVDGKCGPQTQAKLKEVHGC